LSLSTPELDPPSSHGTGFRSTILRALVRPAADLA